MHPTWYWEVMGRSKKHKLRGGSLSYSSQNNLSLVLFHLIITNIMEASQLPTFIILSRCNLYCIGHVNHPRVVFASHTDHDDYDDSSYNRLSFFPAEYGLCQILVRSGSNISGWLKSDVCFPIGCRGCGWHPVCNIKHYHIEKFCDWS